MTAPDRFRSSHSPSGRFAELLLHNGRFYTLDPAQPWAEAVAIRDGRLLAVGRREDMDHLVGPDTLVRDLEGAFCMPGLHDMHTHPDLALNPRYADDLDVGIEDPTPDQLARPFATTPTATPAMAGSTASTSCATPSSRPAWYRTATGWTASCRIVQWPSSTAPGAA